MLALARWQVEGAASHWSVVLLQAGGALQCPRLGSGAPAPVTFLLTRLRWSCPCSDAPLCPARTHTPEAGLSSSALAPVPPDSITCSVYCFPFNLETADLCPFASDSASRRWEQVLLGAERRGPYLGAGMRITHAFGLCLCLCCNGTVDS